MSTAAGNSSNISTFEDVNFANFLHLLCLTNCQCLAIKAAQNEDCPIAGMLLSKPDLLVWQNKLKPADWVTIDTFNKLDEVMKINLIINLAIDHANLLDKEIWLTFRQILNNSTTYACYPEQLDFSTLHNLYADFLSLEKLQIANQREKEQAIFGHCECLLLEAAQAKYKTRRLTDYQLYVNLEPCLLCAAALVTAQVAELFFLAPNTKAGAVCSQIALLDLNWLNHHVLWSQISALPILTNITSQCLQKFFHRLRQRNKKYGSAHKRKQLYNRTDKFD